MNVLKYIKFVVNKFGTKHQMIVAVEELSELQKELTKYLRGQGNRNHVAEEIADVQLMLWQMGYVFKISDEELEKRIQSKINRTLDRICSR